MLTSTLHRILCLYLLWNKKICKSTRAYKIKDQSVLRVEIEFQKILDPETLHLSDFWIQKNFQFLCNLNPDITNFLQFLNPEI